jgi:hypothetical protein
MLSTLRELELDTHVHIHKENNILFPAGIRAEEGLAALNQERSHGARVAPRPHGTGVCP